MVKEKTKQNGKSEEILTGERELILINDNYNTFEYVIKSLIEVCKHDPEQAEQCTFIVHYKGRCGVKSGEFYTLQPLQRELLRRGLTAEIT
jgi:ATP-dependent Clp protease adaptor protein ClpS